MLTGIVFAIAACFVWGMIFVIPEFVADFSPIEVTMGRYLSYGIFSGGLFLRKGFGNFRRFSMKVWGVALVFALLSNILYYVGIVFALRYATAPVTVLILGMCPIIAALYGNWQMREYRYRDLIVPCALILCGMALVNAMEVDWSFSKYGLKKYILGLVSVTGALLSWSWYSVHNARFLKKFTEVPRDEWATIIGVGTLFWVVLFGGILLAIHSPELELAKFTHMDQALLRFTAAAIVLGVLCSWVGCYFWNQASTYLPVSLMGPFIIFETIFGLTFVFLYELRIPSILELIGIGVMLGGIYVAVRNRNRMTIARKPDPES